VVKVGMLSKIGGSVVCTGGQFEYRAPVEVKGVKHPMGGWKTAYPVHKTGEVVERSALSTPLLRTTPSPAFNETSLVHLALQTKAGLEHLSDTWSCWASAQEAARPRCFLPRTRFQRISGEMVTAAELKRDGGDTLVGLDGTEVVVSRAVTHPECEHSVVSFRIEKANCPFTVTCDHRLWGEESILEARALADCQSSARPKISNGSDFVDVLEATSYQLRTAVVEVAFSGNGVVLAWMPAQKRPRGQRLLQPDKAVACLGSPLLAIDRIHALWDHGCRQHILDEARSVRQPRSLSQGCGARSPSWFSQGTRTHDKANPHACNICQVHHRHLLDGTKPACDHGADCSRCHMPHHEQGWRPRRQ